MLEDLKLRPEYDGFIFLAQAARNPPTLASHHHAELEVNLVVKGSITYVADGRRWTFAQRSLLWLFPAHEHQLVDRSADAENYVAVFKPAMVRRSCRSKKYRDLNRKRATESIPHTVLPPEPFEMIRRTMDSLMPGAPPADLLNREGGFGYRSNFVFHHDDPEGLNAGLHHLLLLCWRCHQEGDIFRKPVELHRSVRKALSLLADDPGEFDLPNLARQCAVSPPYLSRLFKAQIGVTIGHYRNSMRLDRFWKILREHHDTTLTEAVFEAGFGSYSQFYKIFENAYGVGPRHAFRKIPH